MYRSVVSEATPFSVGAWIRTRRGFLSNGDEIFRDGKFRMIYIAGKEFSTTLIFRRNKRI